MAGNGKFLLMMAGERLFILKLITTVLSGMTESSVFVSLFFQQLIFVWNTSFYEFSCNRTLLSTLFLIFLCSNSSILE